jgi:carboxypeptidase C (cathepsin A)
MIETRTTFAHLLLAAVVMAAASVPGTAEEAAVAEGRAAPAEVQAVAERLPADRSTRHRLALDGRVLEFTATAGTVSLEAGDGREEADITFVAYTVDGAEAGARPVTFAVNGGPGAASAYLQIGAMGPWVLPTDGEGVVPSRDVELAPNPETWLDFTDLVFVDPVGTGYSRLVEPDDDLRDRYLSIDGDVEALCDFILRWLTASGRIGSPKFFVGESYGGFRGPLVAEKLQTDHGVGLNGIVLVSPVLDFGWWLQPDHAPLPKASLLPSLAAAAMEARGAFDAATQRAAEDYAAGEYLTDLMRGYGDAAAVARMVGRVADLTGLDPQAVEHVAARIDSGDFAREVRRDDGRVISVYDATVAHDAPTPGDGRGPRADPVLDALTAPLTGAMIAHYRETLGWRPDRRYRLLNGGVSRAWDWGGGRGQPEAFSALQRVLALDPEFRVLVAHGYTDLVTPYFGTQLLLRQLPSGPDGRVRQANYRGGHMFYLREDSRRRLREDARALYGEETGQGNRI